MYHGRENNSERNEASDSGEEAPTEFAGVNNDELEILLPTYSLPTRAIGRHELNRSSNNNSNNLLFDNAGDLSPLNERTGRSSCKDENIIKVYLDYFNSDLPLYSNYIRRRNAYRFSHLNNFRRIYNPFSLSHGTEAATNNNNNIVPGNNTNSNPNQSSVFSIYDSLDFDFDNFMNDDNSDNCYTSLVNSSKELYGNLAISTLEKLIRHKLIKFTFISDRIYKKILDVYLFNLEYEKDDKKSMFKMTKLFITCLPSLKFIEKFINRVKFNSEKEKKNIYFIKMSLDIYEDYYKFFDYPLFRKYKNVFLKVVIKFYSKLTEDGMKCINDFINNSLKTSKMRSFEYKTKKEILEYYTNEKFDYFCLHGGLDNSKFIN